MSENAEKRQKLFINKAFQGRFVLNVLLLLLLSFLCSALIVYWLSSGDLLDGTQPAQASIEGPLSRLGASVLIGNVVALLIAGIGVLFLVLYASHKIAGPIFRFERLCEQIGDGQLDGGTRLRKGDQLQDMGRAFEEMVTKLRNRRDKRRQVAGQLLAELEQLQKSPSAAEFSAQIDGMRRLLAQLPD